MSPETTANTSEATPSRDKRPDGPHAPYPYPPLALANRVGSLEGSSNPFDYYERMGRESRDAIVERLPADWDFSGKRILDFGCGAGRTLRHFVAEAAEAEFWGCDIDAASISWMKDCMSPPFHVFVNREDPPLEHEDASFDLIFAISVFTHLAPNWSRWLAEMHRLLKPAGLLLATFMGRGMSEHIAHEPWEEARVGMNVLRYGQSWDLGGPMVMHSPWWIEEHWGRAFEIVSLDEDGFATKPWLDHGSVLLRKRGKAVSARDLELIRDGDEREARALLHNVRQLEAECADLRAGKSHFEARARHLESELSQQEGSRKLLQESVAELEHSLSDAREQNLEAARSKASAEHREAAARAEGQRSARELLKSEQSIARSNARIFALDEALAEATERLERAQRVIEGMQSSVSWRITTPLRALKRRR